MVWLAAAIVGVGFVCGLVLRLVAFVVVGSIIVAMLVLVGAAHGSQHLLLDFVVALIGVQVGYVLGMLARARLLQPLFRTQERRKSHADSGYSRHIGR
jgi:hypothetical protein